MMFRNISGHFAQTISLVPRGNLTTEKDCLPGNHGSQELEIRTPPPLIVKWDLAGCPDVGKSCKTRGRGSYSPDTSRGRLSWRFRSVQGCSNPKSSIAEHGRQRHSGLGIGLQQTADLPDNCRRPAEQHHQRHLGERCWSALAGDRCRRQPL